MYHVKPEYHINKTKTQIIKASDHTLLFAFVYFYIIILGFMRKGDNTGGRFPVRGTRFFKIKGKYTVFSKYNLRSTFL